MTNRHLQPQISFGIRFALIAVNDGSKADSKSRDAPLCGKQRTEIQE